MKGFSGKEKQPLNRTGQCCQETCHQQNIEEKGEKDDGNPVWHPVVSWSTVTERNTESCNKCLTELRRE